MHLHEMRPEITRYVIVFVWSVAVGLERDEPMANCVEQCEGNRKREKKSVFKIRKGEMTTHGNTTHATDIAGQ